MKMKPIRRVQIENVSVEEIFQERSMSQVMSIVDADSLDGLWHETGLYEEIDQRELSQENEENDEEEFIENDDDSEPSRDYEEEEEEDEEEEEEDDDEDD